MNDPALPAIVIAAGGAGHRIGGGKTDRQLGGMRLLDHAIHWAQRHSDRVALAVGTGPLTGFPDLPQLTDRQDGIGPISALQSAMDYAARVNCPRVLLIGCDMPFLPPDLVSRLEQEIGPALAALPRRGERLQTMAGLWRCDGHAIADYIADGGRSLWGLAERGGLVTVDWPGDGADPFANINTPGDLAAAAARLTAPGR